MSTQGRLRRVLLIAYAFPPVGGAGVQRVAKFVKYLPAFGWQASVLTPSNPSVPVMDDTLVADIPPDTLIRRAPTLEPSYSVKNLVSAGTAGTRSARPGLGIAARSVARSVLIRLLQPDPQVLWYPGAAREGRRLLRETPHEAILASGPPFSSFLIGRTLSRSSGLPLVLDYRDEWGLSNRFLENKGYGRLALSFQARLQRRAVRAASALVATTTSSAESVAAVNRDAGGRAEVACIRNGFDPDDFPAPSVGARSGERFRIVYTGTLWNLTSVEPLVNAVERLCRDTPEHAHRLELVFAGRRTADQQGILARLAGLPVRLVEHDYLGHDVVIDLMQSADLLCALLTGAPGAERVLPGKIFEYMAARRPILTIAPKGDLWDVVEHYPSSARFEPRDVADLTAFLARTLADFEPGQASPSQDWDDPRYNRREQAGELAALLDRITGSGRADTNAPDGGSHA